MKRRHLLFLILGLILFTGGWFIIDKQMPREPKIIERTTALKVKGAIPYWDQKRAFSSFKDNVEAIDEITLFWYYVDDEGNVRKYKDAKEDESIVDFAHENGVKALAVITNLPEEGNWDPDNIERAIKDPNKRQEHIQEILELLNEHNFDGVNIDYEELRDYQKDDFTLFIKELSSALHEQGKIVGVSLHPKSGEFIPYEDNGSRAQDWQAIAQHADRLYIMSYGEHWDASNPGPIASINWDARIIGYAQSLNLPLEKIYFGIPLYGQKWEKDKKKSGVGLEYEEIAKLLERKGIEAKWDEKAKSPFFTYEEKGKTYEVWYEDKRSVAEKVDLAEKTGMGGIFFWRLGREDPRVWEHLVKDL